MISQETFFGGARYLAGSGTFSLTWAHRLYRISTTDPTNVVILPPCTRRWGGPNHLVIFNQTSTTLRVARYGEGASPTWTITSGKRGKFHLVAGGSATGDWVADIRTPGAGTVIPKINAAIVGGADAPTGVLRLAPATDTFTAGTSSPNNRQEGGAFSIGQEMFVAGHIPQAGSDAAKLDGYRNDTWRQILTMAISYGGQFAGSGLGLGFFMGGLNLVSTTAFNVRTESVSAKTSMGLHRYRGASASVRASEYASEKVYLIAGDPVQSPSMAYTPILDCYEVLPTYVGTNRRFQAGFGLMGKVYSCGGIDDTVGTHDLVDVLDVATLTWSAGPVLPMGARSAGAAFQANRRGYFGGGNDSAGSRQQHAASLRSGAWVSLSALGANKYQTGCASGVTL